MTREERNEIVRAFEIKNDVGIYVHFNILECAYIPTSFLISKARTISLRSSRVIYLIPPALRPQKIDNRLLWAESWGYKVYDT